MYVCPSSQYAPFLQLISDTKTAESVRDSSLAMARILEVCRDWLNSQTAGAAGTDQPQEKS